jgi:hypothetical protein
MATLRHRLSGFARIPPQNVCRRLLAVGLLFLSGSPYRAESMTDQTPESQLGIGSASMAEVIEASRRRVSAIDSLYLRWTTRHVVFPGAYNHIYSPGASSVDPVSPPTILDMSDVFEFAKSGAMLRLKQMTEEWKASENATKQYHADKLFRDGVDIEYYRYSESASLSSNVSPTNHIQSKIASLPFVIDYLENPAIEVLRTTRMNNSVIALVVGNVDYNDTRKRGVVRREYYLDPAAEFLPIRSVSMYKDGRIKRDAIIEYGERIGPFSVPTRMKMSVFDEQGVLVTEMYDMTVREARINEPIDDDFFELDLPVGTMVSDELANIDYTITEDDLPTSSSLRRLISPAPKKTNLSIEARDDLPSIPSDNPSIPEERRTPGSSALPATAPLESPAPNEPVEFEEVHSGNRGLLVGMLLVVLGLAAIVFRWKK